MKRKARVYSAEQIEQAKAAYESGKHIRSVAEQIGIPWQFIYELGRKHKWSRDNRFRKIKPRKYRSVSVRATVNWEKIAHDLIVENFKLKMQLREVL